jgi:hypothetical protein
VTLTLTFVSLLVLLLVLLLHSPSASFIPYSIHLMPFALLPLLI